MRVKSRNLPITAAIGDFIVFLLFPFIGASSHAMGLTPETLVRTVVPFAITWAAVGLVARAFAPSLLRSPSRTLRTVPAAWLVAGILGILLRSLVFNRPLELTFALIAIGVIGIMLLLWRLVLAAISR